MTAATDMLLSKGKAVTLDIVQMERNALQAQHAESNAANVTHHTAHSLSPNMPNNGHGRSQGIPPQGIMMRSCNCMCISVHT